MYDYSPVTVFTKKYLMTTFGQTWNAAPYLRGCPFADPARSLNAMDGFTIIA